MESVARVFCRGKHLKRWHPLKDSGSCCFPLPSPAVFRSRLNRLPSKFGEIRMTIHRLDTSKDDKHDESNFGPKDGEVFNCFLPAWTCKLISGRTFWGIVMAVDCRRRFVDDYILLMEDIPNNHLICMKPCKIMGCLPYQLVSRILSINRINEGRCFKLPAARFYHEHRPEKLTERDFIDFICSVPWPKKMGRSSQVRKIRDD